MTEEVVQEVITSTSSSAEPKCENLLINSSLVQNLSSVTPDVKRKEKPVPHYLRASTSSCHDSCKFGIKHSSEPKKYWPVSRKQLRRASTGNQEHDQVRVEIILPQKARPRKEDQKLKVSRVKSGSATAPAKPEFITPKASPKTVPDHSEIVDCMEDLSVEASEHIVAETLPTDAQYSAMSLGDVGDCGDGESLDGAESIELEMPLAIQDIDESDEHTEDAILPSDGVRGVEEQPLVGHVPDPSANECANSENKTPQTVPASEKDEQAELGTKSESLLKESVKPKTKPTSGMTRGKGPSLESGRTSRPTSTRTTAVDICSAPKTTRKPADVTATSNPERKFRSTVTSAVQKGKEIKVPSPSNATDSSLKADRLEKLKASTAKTTPSPSPNFGKQTGRKMAGNNVDKNNAQVVPKKREEKVILGPVKLSRSANMSGKSIFSSVKLRTVRKEKIAPPIKTSKKVSGKESSTVAFSPRVRKPEVNNTESGHRRENPGTPRSATARKPRPAPATPSTPVAPAPRKLTFRRGKVVNPEDITGGGGGTPRRLRFRPAAVATADAAARSRGVRTSSRRSNGGSSAAVKATGAEVVVLRRRDGEEAKKKRQEQQLLNDVIEETASRLVAEARKSKVRALVGAFETVISLQETGKAAAAAAAAGAPSTAAAAGAPATALPAAMTMSVS